MRGAYYKSRTPCCQVSDSVISLVGKLICIRRDPRGDIGLDIVVIKSIVALVVVGRSFGIPRYDNAGIIGFLSESEVRIGFEIIPGDRIA